MPSNAMSLSARTAVLTVEPACGRPLVWDLPDGFVVATSSRQPPALDAAVEVGRGAAHAVAMQVSARVGPGAKATIERVGEGELVIRFTPSPSFAHCATDPAAAQLSLQPLQGDTVTKPSELMLMLNVPGETSISYRSAGAAAGSAEAGVRRPEFALLLEGRLTLGATLQQGAGWLGAGPAAVLEAATVRVRTLASGSGQSITLLEEQVDPGSSVDTAPCFDSGPTWGEWWHFMWTDFRRALAPKLSNAQRCAGGMQSPAVGFVRAHRDGALDAQVHAVIQHLAIRPHLGEVRLLGVTVWRFIMLLPFVQGFVAVVVFFSAVAQLLGSIGALHSAETRAPAIKPLPTDPPSPDPGKTGLHQNGEPT